MNGKASITDHIIIYLYEMKKRFTVNNINKENMEKLFNKVGIKINEKKKYEYIKQIMTRIKKEMIKKKRNGIKRK